MSTSTVNAPYVSIGKKATQVSYLAQTRPNRRGPSFTPDPPIDTCVESVRSPDVAWFRAVYHAVGDPWLWTSRKLLSDAALTRLLNRPTLRMFALTHAGRTAGFAELDLQINETDVELVLFGILPEYIGRGLGTYFLEWVSRFVWNETGAHRFWLHTCTLDCPWALRVYSKAGFVKYAEATEWVDLIAPACPPTSAIPALTTAPLP